MEPGKNSVGQVIEAFITIFTLIALSMQIASLIRAISGRLFRLFEGLPSALQVA
jgi:hypothetical protein